MKNRKRTSFWKKNILSIVCIILVIIVIMSLITTDILPIKYILIISFAIFFLNIVGIIIINLSKKKKLKVIGFIVMIVSIAISSLSIYYLTCTKNFITKSFTLTSKNVYQKNTYYVLTLANKNRKKDDISSSISAYIETPNIDEAIKKLNKKYKVSAKKYEDIDTMFDNLNNETDEFLLIEKSAYEIILSISEKVDKNNYDIIYEFDILTERNNNNDNNNTEKFNIYVGGTDFAGLMDFNMIVTINATTHKVLLTSIPRDYYIEVANKEGKRDKLSFMKVHGDNVNKDSLANLFNTNINYSLIVNTNSLVDVVDYVGGIDFCSNYNFTTTHALVKDTYIDTGKKLTIHKGCQHLNGIEALTVARERKAFPGSDVARQENCQKILLDILKKLISADTLLHYNRTLNTLGSLYTTNIPKEIVTSISKDILDNRNIWQIETQAVYGEDAKDKVYLSNLIDWVMYPDMNSVEDAKLKIEETLK